MVNDELYQSPMREVYVELTLDASHAWSMETGEDGRFAFVGLCDGAYTIRALADDHRPLERALTLPLAAPLVLELHDDVEHIVVYGPRAGSESLSASTTLDEAVLTASSGKDLAETAAAVPGVVVQRGNGDTSKPILRGQTERRLLTLFDDVRHEGQKWGPDHATEIDPFAAGSLEVVKGAGGVRYGPDAIGGVLLVKPRPLRVDPGVDGAITLVGAANGQRGTGAARLDGATAGGLAWRIEGNLSRGAALRTPDYVLGNTGSALWNLAGTVGLHRDGYDLTASWRHYHLDAGVFYGIRTESVGDLQAQIASGRPIGADDWRVSYALDRPKQTVDHDLGLVRFDGDAGPGRLRSTLSFQLDHRREYEPVRGTVSGAQFDFTLRTWVLDASWTHDRFHLGHSNAEGTLGATASLQENVYTGLPLVPNYRAGTAGVFAYERVWRHRLEAEVGARYDHQGQTAFLTEEAWQRHHARGNVDESDCILVSSVARCGRAFDAATVTLGGMWRVVPDHLRLKLDLASATRFPDIDELYINGTAPTLPVYALGDPHLTPETSWSGSLTGVLDGRVVNGEVSAYANAIRRYVYFAPDLDEDGKLGIEVLARGAFPRFGTTQIDALFYGGDGHVVIGASWPVALTLQAAIVRGIDAASGDGLVFVPPDRAAATLTVRTPPDRTGPRLTVDVTGRAVARQTRVDPAADLAPPPPGYALLEASAGLSWPLRAGTLDVGVEGTNLTNARYRDYTSLIRYFADEPGRDVRLRVRYSFGPPPDRSKT